MDGRRSAVAVMALALLVADCDGGASGPADPAAVARSSPTESSLPSSAAPGSTGDRSGTLWPIKHVVFLIKENRTFDQVFGQRPGVTGDPSLANLGMRLAVRSKDGTRSIDRVDAVPNHYALADRFTLFDNFYCDSDQSNTGHRWVVGEASSEQSSPRTRRRLNLRNEGR